jgi:hypothetical protein
MKETHISLRRNKPKNHNCNFKHQENLYSRKALPLRISMQKSKRPNADTAIITSNKKT